MYVITMERTLKVSGLLTTGFIDFEPQERTTNRLMYMKRTRSSESMVKS
jgi:hypothetical protein